MWKKFDLSRKFNTMEKQVNFFQNMIIYYGILSIIIILCFDDKRMSVGVSLIISMEDMMIVYITYLCQNFNSKIKLKSFSDKYVIFMICFYLPLLFTGVHFNHNIGAHFILTTIIILVTYNLIYKQFMPKYNQSLRINHGTNYKK